MSERAREVRLDGRRGREGGRGGGDVPPLVRPCLRRRYRSLMARGSFLVLSSSLSE